MTLREELEAEQVRHLDLQRYCQVESGTTVREAVARMRAAGGGTALITRDSELIGIFTERDALRRVAGEPETLDRPFDEVMTLPQLAGHRPPVTNPGRHDLRLHHPVPRRALSRRSAESPGTTGAISPQAGGGRLRELRITNQERFPISMRPFVICNPSLVF